MTTPGQRLHREETRQELPPRRQSLMYPDAHSRGLNHLLDLFGVVHGAIPEHHEQALWSLREILDLYGRYHRRALDAEARVKQYEEWLRFYSPDDVDVDYMISNWERFRVEAAGPE